MDYFLGIKNLFKGGCTSMEGERIFSMKTFHLRIWKLLMKHPTSNFVLGVTSILGVTTSILLFFLLIFEVFGCPLFLVMSFPRVRCWPKNFWVLFWCEDSWFGANISLLLTTFGILTKLRVCTSKPHENLNPIFSVHQGMIS